MATSSVSGNLVLWDVVEEHLAEAEFLIEDLARGLESPILTVRDLARGVVPRLLAHLDGLAIGGAPVSTRLLQPLLREPASSSPARLCAAAILSIEAGRFDDLLPALRHEAAGVRAAAVRACALAGDAYLDRWVEGRWPQADGPPLRASLLGVMAAREVEPPVLVQCLQSGRRRGASRRGTGGPRRRPAASPSGHRVPARSRGPGGP